MCGSMADIHSAAAEIKRGEKEERRTNYSTKIWWSALFHRATIIILYCISIPLDWLKLHRKFARVYKACSLLPGRPRSVWREMIPAGRRTLPAASDASPSPRRACPACVHHQYTISTLLALHCNDQQLLKVIWHKGRIAAAHGRFNRIRQVATMWIII